MRKVLHFVTGAVVFGCLIPAFADDDGRDAPFCHRGAYRLSNGTELVVQPSDGDNLRYRFLDGRSGKLYFIGDGRYESGPGWSGREPVRLRAEFGECDQGRIAFEMNGKSRIGGTRVSLPVIPIQFASGDLQLYGELVMPDEERPKAVVVLQYGGGRESAVLHNYVQYLLPLRGIAVLVFDKRGTGHSEGEFVIDIPMLAEDMVAATRVLKSRPELQGLPLGLMGESQGGWVAPLAATRIPVDFVVASYGLAISMIEEDRAEVEQSLLMNGFESEELAKGEALHEAALRVVRSRFAEGLEELEELKSRFRGEPWFPVIEGDFTRLMTQTPREELDSIRELLSFHYDLSYEPYPVLESLKVPQLWILAAEDTEAPHEKSLAILSALQRKGVPITVEVFPDADHGMIVVEEGPEGRQLAGRTAPGYFELLFNWIGEQAGRTNH
ncbi:alpha/beta hydrolase family protein [Gilvimarinus sp. F26214L]|uniref:alpha/beta hydrolase family protein n=1 Tax=Gilvimarinus sp. DZF01 TaxID=3461371 RepID=UPI00404676B5